MQKITYIVKAERGIHLLHANQLADLAKHYPDTTATMTMGTRTADVAQLMQVAKMGVRKDDVIAITAEGPSEVELLDVLHQYFEANL